jgi:thiosulfate/3-mercaptopyruvate sulfurtransferase
LEAWEKVLINLDAFVDNPHGWWSCIDCHGGVDTTDKEAAHEGLVSDPSSDADVTCGLCHAAEWEAQSDSLHFNLAGYDGVLEARSEPDAMPHLEEMQTYHCDNCHATCGQCHVSQPESVGGGLLDAHEFSARASMTRTCTACHGSRVGNEYLGKNEGFLADVHFRQGRMVCADCHTGADIHGQENPDAMNRYEGPQIPACADCHPEAATKGSSVVQHTLHQDRVSCQVCHSVSYKSCDGCHTARDEEGRAFFETDGSYMTFLIGLNPLKSEERPYDYVPLRHVPIAEDSFEYYGEDLLSNFDARPTWAYATPHNIQRETPQNSSCENCHGNEEIFLTLDKLYPEEIEANRSVIVTEIPGSSIP